VLSAIGQNQTGLAGLRPLNCDFLVCLSFSPFHYVLDLRPKTFTRSQLPANKMHREDPCTPHEPAICSAINSLPAPYARAGHMAFSSNPYRFMPGQPGQPGQTPESLANRSFRIFNLHTYTGTQPGHAGTIRFQDVSGRAKHHIYGRAPPSRVVRFRRFCSHSQAGPSVPPCSLVGVARHWLEALAAAQPIGRRRIGPTGDQLTAGGRQASAIVRQVPALRTAPPVVPGPFRRTNARQPELFWSVILPFILFWALVNW